MGLVVQEPPAQLIETETPDTFCSGLVRIEPLAGGCLRFVIYVDQLDQDGKAERVVVARLVIPTANVPHCIQQTVATLVTLGVNILVRPPALMN